MGRRNALPPRMSWSEALEFAQLRNYPDPETGQPATQAKCAEIFGVTERTIHNWERSQWYPLACAELDSGGLTSLIAKARAALMARVTSENERVSLDAAKFILTNQDPEFMPLEAREALKRAAAKGSELAGMSDSELANLRAAFSEDAAVNETDTYPEHSVEFG